jgi:LPXTG-motif cell wall-anchored protein
MRFIKTLAVLFAAALALTFMSPPASADDDLDCGDPGTTPNMSVPADDPHDLDDDDDGIGCEDDSVTTTVPAPATTQPQAAAPTTTVAPGTPEELPRTGASSTTIMGVVGAGILAVGAFIMYGRHRLLAWHEGR